MTGNNGRRGFLPDQHLALKQAQQTSFRIALAQVSELTNHINKQQAWIDKGITPGLKRVMKRDMANWMLKNAQKGNFEVLLDYDEDPLANEFIYGLADRYEHTCLAKIYDQLSGIPESQFYEILKSMCIEDAEASAQKKYDELVRTLRGQQ
jgi:hypothetical protein